MLKNKIMGRAKQEQYQYSKEGKFIRKYDSLSEVREKYGKTAGNFYGIGDYKRNYRFMEDNTYICNERLGRVKIQLIDRIENCPFCQRTGDKRQKAIEVYNLLGSKIAEFDSIATLCKMRGVNESAIWNRLKANTTHKPKNDDTLIYRYKKS